MIVRLMMNTKYYMNTSECDIDIKVHTMSFPNEN